MTRFLVATLLLCVATAQAASSYTQEMFRRSLDQAQTFTTAGPLYVIITLRDPSRGTERTAAIAAPFLFGAIDFEHHLPVPDPEHPPKNDAEITAKRQRKELQIALSQPDRTFTFLNRQARKNVAPRYTPEVFAKVRHQLSLRSRGEIIAAVHAKGSWLHRLYLSKRNWAEIQGYKDAVAHVLLERGILVGQKDEYAGRIYIPDK
jgi:hypothetical protein